MIPAVNRIQRDQTGLLNLLDDKSQRENLKFLSESSSQLMHIPEGMASVSFYFLYGCVGVLMMLSTVVIYVISKLFNQNILEQQEKIRLKKNNDQHSKLILDLEERIQRLTDNKNTSIISKRESSKINQSAVLDDKRKLEFEIEQLENEKQWFKNELDKAQDTIRDNTSANLRLCTELQFANDQCQSSEKDLNDMVQKMMQGKKENKALTDVMQTLNLEKEKNSQRATIALEEKNQEYEKKYFLQDEANNNKIQQVIKEKMNEFMRQKMDYVDDQKKEQKKLKQKHKDEKQTRDGQIFKMEQNHQEKIYELDHRYECMCNDFEAQIKALKQEQISEKEKIYNHDQKIYEKEVEIQKLQEFNQQLSIQQTNLQRLDKQKTEELKQTKEDNERLQQLHTAGEKFVLDLQDENLNTKHQHQAEIAAMENDQQTKIEDNDRQNREELNQYDAKNEEQQQQFESDINTLIESHKKNLEEAIGKGIKAQMIEATLKRKNNEIFILESSIEEIKKLVNSQRQDIELYEKNKKIQDRQLKENSELIEQLQEYKIKSSAQICELQFQIQEAQKQQKQKVSSGQEFRQEQNPNKIKQMMKQIDKFNKQKRAFGSANSDYSTSVKIIDDYSIVHTDDELSDANHNNGVEHREYQRTPNQNDVIAPKESFTKNLQEYSDIHMKSIMAGDQSFNETAKYYMGIFKDNQTSGKQTSIGQSEAFGNTQDMYSTHQNSRPSTQMDTSKESTSVTGAVPRRKRLRQKTRRDLSGN